MSCFFLTRPLTGIMVLMKQFKGGILYVQSFRPLTGIVVLITFMIIREYCIEDIRFRPLTGIVVLIR